MNPDMAAGCRFSPSPPAARQHTIYLTSEYEERWPEFVSRLGRYRSGTSCLYLTRLSGVDETALRELLRLTRNHTLAEWAD